MLKLLILPLVLLGLSGCADSNINPKYRDMSELEKPPQLETVQSTTEQAEDGKTDSEELAEAEVKTNDTKHTAHGLKDAVSLADESHLIINRPFSEAWLLVARALRISGMEISDRNLDKGQYYVLFDPDTANLKNGEKPGFLTTLFTDDEHPKGRYLLTFYESKRSVKLSVEFLEYFSSGVQTESSLPDKGVEKLLKKLYTALHDDLPIN